MDRATMPSPALWGGPQGLMLLPMCSVTSTIPGSLLERITGWGGMKVVSGTEGHDEVLKSISG